MYVGLKQPRGDGERYVTPARAAAKETIVRHVGFRKAATKRNYFTYTVTKYPSRSITRNAEIGLNGNLR